MRDSCHRGGLKLRAFRRWRQELARRDEETSAPSSDKQEGEPTEATPVFLPVRVLDLDAVTLWPVP
jgi:hypothetical protein